MYVVFLSIGDYASVGAVFAKCLNKVGVTAYSFSKKSTSYYPSCHSIVYKNMKEVEKAVKRADVVVWMHSQKVPIKSSLKGKKEVVFHGGTIYRRFFHKLNRRFKHVHVSLIQTAELLGLGAKKEVWMLPAAYIADVEPNYSMGSKIVVGHFPSAPKAKDKRIVGLSGGTGMDLTLKGSYIINRIMKKRYKDKVKYKFSRKRVKWIENLERMNRCDIYIESLNSASVSDNKHDWSVAALEAAALGDVVVTNFKFGEKRYKREYGDCPLQVVNTERQFIQTMDRLLSMSREDLLALKHRTRDWAMSTHGLKAVGLRLRKTLEI